MGLIRDPEPSDLHSVIALESRVFGKVWTAERYVKELSTGSWAVLVIGPVGKVRAALWYRKRRGHVELETLGTARQWRGKGYGSTLLLEMQRRHRKLRGWVREDNANALRLYATLGFQIIRRSPKYFGAVAGLRIEWKK